MGFDAVKAITKNKVFLTGLEGLLSTVFPSALLQAQHSMRSLLMKLACISHPVWTHRAEVLHVIFSNARLKYNAVKCWAQCDILSWRTCEKALARGRNFCLIVRIKIVHCSEYFISLMARICPEFACCVRHLPHFLSLLFKPNHTFLYRTQHFGGFTVYAQRTICTSYPISFSVIQTELSYCQHGLFSFLK